MFDDSGCKLLLALACIAQISHSIYAARFLVITAGDNGSHFFLLRRVGEALALKGHNVTFLSTEREARILASQETKFNYSVVSYPDGVSEEEYNDFIRAVSDNIINNNGAKRSLINGVVGRKLLNVCSKTSESILKNTDLIEHLRHQEFDLALFESIASWCGYVAKALNVPFVTMSTLSTTPDKAWENRADVNPAYYPAYSSGYDQGMNFTQRFVNTMVYMQVFLSRFAFFWTLESTHSPHSYIPAGLSTPHLCF